MFRQSLTAASLLAALSLGNTASAEYCSGPRWEIGADFLYAKPCVDGLQWGASAVDNPNVVFYTLDPDWEPGVQVHVKGHDLFCGIGLCLSYTWFESDTNDKKMISPDEGSNPLLRLAMQSPNNWDHITGQYNLKYHEWHIAATMPYCLTPCDTLVPFVGIAGLKIDQDFSTLHTETFGGPLQTVWSSDLSAWGLRAGTVYSKMFSDSFSLYGKFHASLVAGSPDNEVIFQQQQSGSNTIIKEMTYKNDSDSCQLFPGYGIALGAAYNACLCGFQFGLHLAYEFSAWHNLPAPRIFTNNSINSPILDRNTISTSNTRNIGYHGPKLGLSLQF